MDSALQKTVLWNRNDLLRFRFRLWKSFGSGSGSGYPKTKKLHKILPFQCIRSMLFSRKLASLFWFFYFFYILCGMRIQIRFRNRNRNAFRFRFHNTKVTVPAVPVPAPLHCRKEILLDAKEGKTSPSCTDYENFASKKENKNILTNCIVATAPCRSHCTAPGSKEVVQVKLARVAAIRAILIFNKIIKTDFTLSLSQYQQALI